MPALFIRDGEYFVPTEHTRGPWSATAQHGGPPAALLARALEAVPSETPMRIARCTVEILRPVPLEPLRVDAAVERASRRVQLLRATLWDQSGETVCVARAWRLRTALLGTPDTLAPTPFQGPADAAAHVPESEEPAFHRTGVELRFARGSFWETGPAIVWIRLRQAVVDGETPSPLMRALAAADFGNGIASALEWGRFLYINTDLSVFLHRQPSGEWIALDASTAVGPDGIGVTRSALYDEHAAVGQSLQTLFIDRLTTAP